MNHGPKVIEICRCDRPGAAAFMSARRVFRMVTPFCRRGRPLRPTWRNTDRQRFRPHRADGATSRAQRLTRVTATLSSRPSCHRRTTVGPRPSAAAARALLVSPGTGSAPSVGATAPFHATRAHAAALAECRWSRIARVSAARAKPLPPRRSRRSLAPRPPLLRCLKRQCNYTRGARSASLPLLRLVSRALRAPGMVIAGGSSSRTPIGSTGRSPGRRHPAGSAAMPR
jgi:hypothetical protein